MSGAGKSSGDGLWRRGWRRLRLGLRGGEHPRLPVGELLHPVALAAVLLLVVCLVGRQALTGYDGRDWLKLVALTAGAQLLGHSLFNVVLRTTSPTVVSLSILFEIPGAALIAALFVSGQHVPWLAVPSAALLVAGLALVIRAGSPPAVPVE